MGATDAERRVIQIELEPGLICLRGLSPRRLRFEIEYGLERGTSANSFLFEGGDGAAGRPIPPVLVHPPGDSFAAPFLEQLTALVPAQAELKVIVGHVNPNRVALLRRLAAQWPALMLVASNAGARLLEDLWGQQRPAGPDATAQTQELPPLPPIDVVKQEGCRPLAHGFRLCLYPTPTPRWPGSLMAFEERTGLLMSGKFFAAHLCSEAWAETSRNCSEEDRRYFYDCLMAPMARQVEAVVDRLDDLPIRAIAPGHGPAISSSWRSLLADYRRWGESQGRTGLTVSLLYASAYGNTAAIADAIAQGVSRSGVRVESLNCEFASSEQLLAAIRDGDALLIGSPTLGGHAPTPIVSALGTVLAEGDRDKPVGVFGSFGWSGEAIDLLEISGGTYERPVLFGRAEIDRGEVTFEGRRYLVTRGNIDFTNPAKIEPFFDVEAETRVRVPGQTYRVIVRAAGTLDRLQPELSSDPPLPPPDVLALPFSDVRRSQGPGDVELRALQNPTERQRDILTTRATQLLANPLSAEVGRVVEQTFGVDTFQVTPSLIDPYNSSTGRLNPSARVTIGKRISDRVYLTYSRSLSSSFNDQIILLEYDESDRFSWILSRNEDSTYAIEVRVRHAF